MTRPHLLPSDRWIARRLGWTDQQMERFNLDAMQRAAAQPPARATAGIEVGALAVSLLISTAITVGATIISSLLTPRPRRPGTVETTNEEGKSRISSSRFAPSTGFAANQDIAVLGQEIPLVYALREDLPALNGRPAGLYGGIRVPMLQVWAEMRAAYLSQGFRGVFIISEGPLSEVDPDNFAFGSTSLQTYDLGSDAAKETGSLYSIYFRGNGGRLTSADRISGRLASLDPFNAQNEGAGDVFQVRSFGGGWETDFCSTSAPTAASQFGLYGVIGNNLGYRKNPQLRPTRQFFTRPSGDNQKVDPEDDGPALGAFWKSRYSWSGRWGITSTSIGGSGLVALPVGATFNYRLDFTSDFGTSIKIDNGVFDMAVTHKEDCTDIAGSVAARQNTAASFLSVGSLYRAGSCVAVLEAKSPDNEVFRSEVEGQGSGGTTMNYTFRVVRAGTVQVIPITDINPSSSGTELKPPRAGGDAPYFWDFELLPTQDQFATATNTPQIFQVSIGGFTLARAARVFTIGLSYSLGIAVNGFCNLYDSDTLKRINERAGGERGEETVDSGERFNNVITQSGVVSQPQPRWSFWRLSYRASVEDDYTVVTTHLFGARGETRQALNVWMTVEMPAEEPWEVEMMPISGWEIRSGTAAGDLVVLDTSISGIKTVNAGPITIRYQGRSPITTRVEQDFNLRNLEPNRSSSILEDFSTVTVGTGYEPGTYTNVRILQGGLGGALATVVVPGGGTVDTPNITITTEGGGYGDGDLRLGGGSGPGGTMISGLRQTVTEVRVFALPSRLVIPGHGLDDAEQVIITSTGSVPAPLLNGGRYNVVLPGTDEISLTTTPGPPLGITLTSTGSGTIQITSEAYTDDITDADVNISTDEITVLGHPGQVGWQVTFAADGGSLPSPLVNGQWYYIQARTTDTIKLSTTSGGAAIDLTTPGTGDFIVSMIKLPTQEWIGSPELGKSNLGLGWTEDGAITDRWGELAEAFVYNELTTTAQSGPEWTVTFVNTIVENDAAPLYDDLAEVGMTVRSSPELSSLSQPTAYVPAGLIVRLLLEDDDEGPTHLFPDILRDRMLNERWGNGNSFTEDQIDIDSFIEAAQWNHDRRYFCDARFGQPENIRRWAGDMAAMFLLFFGEANGRAYLRPAISFDPVVSDAFITPGNAEEDTFRLVWRDSQDREPFQVSVRWREERDRNNLTSPGLFPVVREALVREAGVPDSVRIVPMDMTAFCTNPFHAIDAAKFAIRYARLTTHDIEIEGTYALEVSKLKPDSFFEFSFPYTYFSNYRNGAVLSTGQLLASEPLANGAYSVIAWDGDMSTPSAPATLTVSGGGTTATPTGIAFTIPVTGGQRRWYRAQSIKPLPDGRYSIRAQFWPCDDEGNMLIAADWDDEEAWIIQE